MKTNEDNPKKMNVGDTIYNMTYVVAVAKNDGYPVLIEEECNSIEEAELVLDYKTIEGFLAGRSIYHKTVIFEKVR